jgi:hypothetical protein
MITKIMVSAAIVLGSLVVGAAPAGADANSAGTNPNPYGGLRCSCREAAPADSHAEIRRGLREGLAVPVPGLSAHPNGAA